MSLFICGSLGSEISYLMVAYKTAMESQAWSGKSSVTICMTDHKCIIPAEFKQNCHAVKYKYIVLGIGANVYLSNIFYTVCGISNTVNVTLIFLLLCYIFHSCVLLVSVAVFPCGSGFLFVYAEVILVTESRICLLLILPVFMEPQI